MISPFGGHKVSQLGILNAAKSSAGDKTRN
jgi:hypothetical protein